MVDPDAVAALLSGLRTSDDPPRSILDGLDEDDFKDVESWNFNIFKLASRTRGVPLVHLGFEAIRRCCDFEALKLDKLSITKFLLSAEHGYRRGNYFHNSLHASDVTQAVLCLLRAIEDGYEKKNVDCPVQFTNVERFALLIAAALHDIGHPMMNNSFHVRVKSRYAEEAQNVSVLEKLHLKLATKLVKESNLTDGMGPEEKEQFWFVLETAIAATDMELHKPIMDAMGDDKVPLKKRAIQLIIKCADISNPVRQWDQCVAWARLVIDEFWHQGDVEASVGLKHLFGTDRDTVNIQDFEVGFVTHMVLPTFTMFNHMLGRIPAIIEQGKSNMDAWAGSNTPLRKTSDLELLADADHSHLSSVQKYWDPLVPFHPMLEPVAFGDLEVVKRLSRRSNSLCVGANPADLSKRVIFKAYSGDRQLERGRHEMAMLKKIGRSVTFESPSLVESEGGNGCALVFEHPSDDPIPLDEFVGHYTVLTVATVLEIAVALTAAVQAVHSSGVLHLDIDPSNIIWIPKSKQLRLISFDNSRTCASSGEPGDEASNPNPTARPTTAYMSPEVAGEAKGPITGRSDVFSVGASLYTMVAGGRECGRKSFHDCPGNVNSDASLSPNARRGSGDNGSRGGTPDDSNRGDSSGNGNGNSRPADAGQGGPAKNGGANSNGNGNGNENGNGHGHGRTTPSARKLDKALIASCAVKAAPLSARNPIRPASPRTGPHSPLPTVRPASARKKVATPAGGPALTPLASVVTATTTTAAAAGSVTPSATPTPAVTPSVRAATLSVPSPAPFPAQACRTDHASGEQLCPCHFGVMPHAFCRIVLKMLASQPQERYPDMETAVADLTQLRQQVLEEAR